MYNIMIHYGIYKKQFSNPYHTEGVESNLEKFTKKKKTIFLTIYFPTPYHVSLLKISNQILNQYHNIDLIDKNAGDFYCKSCKQC